jgi:sigma-B regulation protein RsbU (phosphoserine phosphatase)
MQNDDLEVLMLLASQVAIIIEKGDAARSVDRESSGSRHNSRSRGRCSLNCCPARDPQLEGFDISAYNFPTEEVSGDYYDWVKIYDDQIGIVIADVSGKGRAGALLMAFLRASLRCGFAHWICAASFDVESELPSVGIDSNETSSSQHFMEFSTRRTARFAYSNAGHNPPMLIDVDGTAHFEERGGVPLGMFRDSRYYEYYATIAPGQILVLYTDGVTEATNPGGEEYGRDRLAEAVRNARDLPAREMIDVLHRDLMTWTDGQGAGDDVTFFILKAL